MVPFDQVEKTLWRTKIKIRGYNRTGARRKCMQQRSLTESLASEKTDGSYRQDKENSISPHERTIGTVQSPIAQTRWAFRIQEQNCLQELKDDSSRSKGFKYFCLQAWSPWLWQVSNHKAEFATRLKTNLNIDLPLTYGGHGHKSSYTLKCATMAEKPWHTTNHQDFVLKECILNYQPSRIIKINIPLYLINVPD